MDEVYRGYRIAVRIRSGGHEARITTVRGPAITERPVATAEEGEDACRVRARAAVDRYILFLTQRP